MGPLGAAIEISDGSFDMKKLSGLCVVLSLSLSTVDAFARDGMGSLVRDWPRPTSAATTGTNSF
jgi:hypothetical protein